MLSTLSPCTFVRLSLLLGVHGFATESIPAYNSIVEYGAPGPYKEFTPVWIVTLWMAFGGMIYPVDSELSQRISRRRGDESPLPMITYCAGCRMALAGCGKEAIHILDFLLSPDWKKMTRKKPPGSLLRYFNRLRTKRAFKKLRPLESA